MSSHRREMKGHTDRFLYLLKNIKSSRALNRVTLFAKLSSIFYFFIFLNVFTHSTSCPCSCIYQWWSLVGEKAFSAKVRWLKVKSHGPKIRTHRCGASGRLMRAARWMRRRSSLNQYAIEQESSDWFITLVCLNIFIISLQPGKACTV